MLCTVANVFQPKFGAITYHAHNKADARSMVRKCPA